MESILLFTQSAPFVCLLPPAGLELGLLAQGAPGTCQWWEGLGRSVSR